ncbi:hypothetical protein M3Y99_01587800 [Aphelenchoides fujianensis]|nr:hypothetical protein M3Y99_01587800 [Aphelenchoides fujianensis]
MEAARERKITRSVQTTNSVSDTQVVVPQAVQRQPADVVYYQQQASYQQQVPYQYYYSQPTYNSYYPSPVAPGVGAFYLTPQGLGLCIFCLG